MDYKEKQEHYCRGWLPEQDIDPDDIGENPDDFYDMRREENDKEKND